MTGVRIWELTVLASFVAALAYWWYAIRTRFALGMLVGFVFCFGWTWLFDEPFLLRLSFDPRAVGGFTWGGHWEPLWTAFSYSALALPVLACLRYREAMARRFGPWRYSLIGYGISLPIQLYEGGYGIDVLHVETYHWKRGLLWFDAPFLNALLLVPLLVILPLVFADQLAPDRNAPAGPERAAPAFLAGFASVQAGFYLTFLVMAVVLNILQPWTP